MLKAIHDQYLYQPANTVTPLACTYPVYYYYINQLTGVPLSSLPYKSSTYCYSGRPFWGQAMKNRNHVTFYGPISSSKTGLIMYTAVLSYYRYMSTYIF